MRREREKEAGGKKKRRLRKERESVTGGWGRGDRPGPSQCGWFTTPRRQFRG